MESDAAITAGLVGAVIGLIELVKKGVSKANGDSDSSKLVIMEARIASLTSELEAVKTKLSAFHRDFCIMRESFNIFLAVEKAKEDKGD